MFFTISLKILFVFLGLYMVFTAGYNLGVEQMYSDLPSKPDKPRQYSVGLCWIIGLTFLCLVFIL